MGLGRAGGGGRTELDGYGGQGYVRGGLVV